MRVLVVFAHPVETSFAAALHQTVKTALIDAGHEIDDCDLYSEGFAAALSRAERLGYYDEATNTQPVADYVERLRAAEAIVLVYPVWNFGMPAMLKGFFDRVFLPGVSFRLENGEIFPNLTNIRKVMVVTTYGARRWRAFLIGDPPRKIGKRFFRAVFRTPRPVRYLALYDMNNVTAERRGRFLDKVRQAARAF